MSIKESLLWHQMHVYELKFPMLFYPRALGCKLVQSRVSCKLTVQGFQFKS